MKGHALSVPAILVVIAVLALGQSALGDSAADASGSFDSSPYSELYRELLVKYTRAVPEKVGTRVDYPGLLVEPRWKKLVARLAAVDPAELETREERLAFWLNAYNILAIDVVLGGYPVESIRDIGSFFSPVWKKEAGRIGGKGRSLDEIEHQILRPMGEPRIHAAIVCASISCPDLRREPFEASELDAQLDEQLRRWLANAQKGSRLDEVSETLVLSSIFRWFDEDFAARGGVLEFIEPYLPAASRSWLAGRAEQVRLDWFDYDWKLNE